MARQVGNGRAWAIREVLPVLVAAEGGGEATIGHAADWGDAKPNGEDRDEGETENEGGEGGGHVGEDTEHVVKEATVSKGGDHAEDDGECEPQGGGEAGEDQGGKQRTADALDHGVTVLVAVTKVAVDDAGIDARKEARQDAWETGWPDQRFDSICVAAACAKPAAVLDGNRLIEAERLDVGLLLLRGEAGIIRVLLLRPARSGKEKCVDEDGGAEEDQEACGDAAQREFQHSSSSLHPRGACRILADYYCGETTRGGTCVPPLVLHHPKAK